MLNKKNARLDFVRVRKTYSHVRVLYELLRKRTHRISHSGMPRFKEHRAFVANHPYRAWYLVMMGDQCIGSIYLVRDNSIGLNLVPGMENFVVLCLEFLLSKFRPLPAIKSVRAAGFHLNVSIENKKLISILSDFGAKPVQLTFAISPN